MREGNVEVTATEEELKKEKNRRMGDLGGGKDEEVTEEE